MKLVGEKFSCSDRGRGVVTAVVGVDRGCLLPLYCGGVCVLAEMFGDFGIPRAEAKA